MSWSIIGFCALIIILIIDLGPPAEAPPIAPPADEPVAEEPVVVEPVPDLAAEPEVIPEPEPIEFSGHGDGVSPEFILEEGITVIIMTHDGRSTFAIWLFAKDGYRFDSVPPLGCQLSSQLVSKN